MALINRVTLPLLVVCAGAAAAPQSHFDANQRRWTLAGSRMEAVIHLTPEGFLHLERIGDPAAGVVWTAPEKVISSPIRLQAGSTLIDSATLFTLRERAATELRPGGLRETITLEDQRGTGDVRIAFDVYDDHPVLRWQVFFRNTQRRAVKVTTANMLPLAFADASERFRVFRVNQWALDRAPVDFEPLTSNLDPNGPYVEVFSGARGQQCGWVAIRDGQDRGLFAGWEFDGRARTRVTHFSPDGLLRLSSTVLETNHPVPAGDEFEVPAAFVGVFRGDWDEAGYRTQQFVETALAKPAPEPDKFPYVGWDSWGYGQNIDEQTLRREAEIAASLGVELFTVDLGWARRLGDWHPDPEKFPHGLRALSDYVHALGMKFGLHFAFAEADPESPVLRENSGWRSSESYGYYGADSLCLAHKPARDWIAAEAVRLIDEFNVDWILQDGENMVKHCTRTDHTHDPADSNYANAVDGLASLIERIQKERPHVAWENCENGGNMMTFGMVRRYVTSITNDASGAFSARRSMFGATYPFPPRYATRYMPQADVDRGMLRSYLFGGPWQLMIRLTTLPPDQMSQLAAEIENFKRYRGVIREGKVYHLTAPPASTRIDAIASYDRESSRGVALISRPHAAAATRYQLRLRDLDEARIFRVFIPDAGQTLYLSGGELMSSGVRINLPDPDSAAIVYFEAEAQETDVLVR